MRRRREERRERNLSGIAEDFLETMGMNKTTLLSLATASALAFSLAACGGNSPSSTSTTQQSPGSGAAGTPPASTAVVTAGDAPMANVLAVQVTLSSVTATNANGTVTNL